MRVLVLSHYWAPEIGAPQRRWRWLAEGLTARGHELAVLTPSPHYPAGRLLESSATYAPGTIHRDASGALIHRTAFRPYDAGLGGRGADQAVAAAHALRLGLRRFAGANRPDVIVGSVPGLPTLPTALALGRGLRRPVVVELRDAWPDILASAADWGSSPGRAGSRWSRVRRAALSGVRGAIPPVVTRLEREAAAIVTTTDSFARVLRGRGMGRVVTVRNTAVPRDWALPAVPREQPDEALHVLYLGTVGRAQGLRSAVRAAALARAQGTRMVLRIVGEGADLAPTRCEAEELGAPVEILPMVPADRVAAHYAWADSVLVSLQDWPSMELTVPSKLYEVMATGRHVSVAAAGAAGRIVKASRSGDVVPPQDPAALARLWQELAADRDRLVVTGGRPWLEAHASCSALLDRYEAVLERTAHA